MKSQNQRYSTAQVRGDLCTPPQIPESSGSGAIILAAHHSPLGCVGGIPKGCQSPGLLPARLGPPLLGPHHLLSLLGCLFLHAWAPPACMHAWGTKPTLSCLSCPPDSTHTLRYPYDDVSHLSGAATACVHRFGVNGGLALRSPPSRHGQLLSRHWEILPATGTNS